MSAILLAKSIVDRRDLLDLRGELGPYVARLANTRVFSVGEMADFSGMSAYQVRSHVAKDVLTPARSGIRKNHLDFVLRMVDNPGFAKIYAKRLLKDGATVSALARVTGHSERSLRRWTQGGETT